MCKFAHVSKFSPYEWGLITCVRRIIYTFLNVCPFNYTTVAGNEKVRPVNHVNHTIWVVVVFLTDRVQSKVLVAVFFFWGGGVMPLLPF